MFISGLVARNARIFSRIYYNTSFNQQLGAGTLPRQIFKFYLQQDTLYLHDFSKTLLLISNRLIDTPYAQQFRQLAEEMVSAELNIHLKYLRAVEPGTFFAPSQRLSLQKIPVIANYTEHLLYSASTAPIAEAVASCIPCFLIYNELGRQMNARCLQNNPYRDWIRSYSSLKFTSSTQLIIRTMNELAHTNSCPILQEKISAAFLKSALFELNFFEAAGAALSPSTEHIGDCKMQSP